MTSGGQLFGARLVRNLGPLYAPRDTCGINFGPVLALKLMPIRRLIPLGMVGRNM
jgi:hypothetical protein